MCIYLFLLKIPNQQILKKTKSTILNKNSIYLKYVFVFRIWIVFTHFHITKNKCMYFILQGYNTINIANIYNITQQAKVKYSKKIPI